MSNRNRLYWILQLSGWAFVCLVVLFFAHVYKVKISNSVLLGRLAVLFVSGIATTHLLRIFLKWKGWMMLSIEKAIPRMIVALIVTSLLHTLIILWAIDLFKLYTENQKKLNFFARLFGSTVDNGLYILPWLLIYYFYHFIEKSRKQQLDTLQLKALIKELELKTIKAHINPHFIFNSLNSIRALIDENPQRARRAITELSNILRSSMQADKSETVSFEKELSIVKDYLALENMRFEDRLKVEYQIDEKTLDQPVPPMMLQTLVENAIKHGISKQINGGTIRIISDFSDQYHELAVQNTGILNGSMNAEGFGLSSTQNRLSLLYGDKASFQIRQINPSTVEAKLLLPVEAAKVFS
ncbi:MAG: sensor histidine kinase [Chitinophagaceae bacterium]